MARALKGARVGIDEIGDLHALHAREGADMRIAPAMQSGDAQADDFVGPEHAARRFGAGHGDRRGGGKRILNETDGVSGTWRVLSSLIYRFGGSRER